MHATVNPSINTHRYTEAGSRSTKIVKVYNSPQFFQFWTLLLLNWAINIWATNLFQPSCSVTSIVLPSLEYPLITSIRPSRTCVRLSVLKANALRGIIMSQNEYVAFNVTHQSSYQYIRCFISSGRPNRFRQFLYSLILNTILSETYVSSLEMTRRVM